MIERFVFKKVEPGSLEHLREMQLKELKGQVQDFIEEGIVTYKADFVKIAMEGETAGYACIGTYGYYKDIVLEYYLMDPYRSHAGEVFKQLASFCGCKGWFVNTQDSFALPVMLDLELAFVKEGYIFAVDCSRSVKYKLEQGLSFEIAHIDELNEVYELIMQDHFYTGGGKETVEARIATGDELYSLRINGKLAGVGFTSILKRTPHYAEIAMIINPDVRRKGWGTLIVKALIHECRRRNIIPTASCYVKNESSRRTLQRAGFHLEGCILLAQIK